MLVASEEDERDEAEDEAETRLRHRTPAFVIRRLIPKPV
jgi:hypothetical protein